MPRSNYHHVRKQKELARKARQQEKQQRRSVRPDANEPGSTEPAVGPQQAAPPGSGK
ncbi:MAG TPA: hypothetical protein VMB48_13650 [Steroidobacteraceae bacterium]|nr:hypothetical protein [Steroidobacteraceae bacterium]